jgi:hypothetical protein
MENRTQSVGDQLEARCTKCREVTNHTLIALVDERPVRVKCNTCSGEHIYQAPRDARKIKGATAAPPAPKKKAGTGRAKPDPRNAERQEWENLRPKMNTDRAIDYAMDGQFKLNALVNHPIFGIGLVQQVTGAKKMGVLFQDGRKLLRCH